MAIVRFSLAARSDITAILRQSHRQFGMDARLRYERLLVTAFRHLSEDPTRPGAVVRQEIGPGVYTYHLRHSRERARHESGAVHRPRHIILYRSIDPGLIGVGRVLHEAMDIDRHIPATYGDERG